MNYKDINTDRTYLITGAAGFIGFFLAKRLLEGGFRVIGIDNINDYYDIHLKHGRLKLLEPFEGFIFVKGDISDKETVMSIFQEYKPHIVINLAAQAGVRYSIENPEVYIQSNVIGFFNILEACRYYPVEHLLYASSSSVYGGNKKLPFQETDFVDKPLSLYAATKKSNELMAFTYSHLYGIAATGLRFFTVYGPMGRPDMAYFSFTDNYFKGEPIRIFNNGDLDKDLYRDFTYIDDIVEGIVRLLNKPHGHRIFNIGNSSPVKLMDFIEALERALSNSLRSEVIFHKIYEPMNEGDAEGTYASIDKLYEASGFKPETTLEKGLQAFADWYVKYYLKKIYRA